MSSPAPVHGLILAGGRSSRMQRDKAALPYRGQTQLERVALLLQAYVNPVFFSVRTDQAADAVRRGLPQIHDSVDGEGPLVGIRSAFAEHPHAAWLVVACDLPFLSGAALEQLLAQRDTERVATCFKSTHDGLPEPLCAIWEPRAADAIEAYATGGGRCPRKFLLRHDVCVLQPADPRALDNVNTPEEYQTALAALDDATALGS